MFLNNKLHTIYIEIVKATIFITIFNILILSITLFVSSRIHFQMLNIAFYILNLFGLVTVLRSKVKQFPKLLYLILFSLNLLLLLFTAYKILENPNLNTLALYSYKMLYLFLCTIIFIIKLLL